MRQPESPPKGKVMVLSNSFLDEWKPDIVPEMFNNVAEAETWIRANLDEEPGDLYVICSVEAMFWAQIEIRRQPRRKK